MAFDPTTLPKPVYEKYKLGAIAWPLVVQKAVLEHITDVDRLTSIVFYLHHPERNGRAIESWEIKEVTEWKNFRSLVRPMVPVMSKPSEPSPSDVQTPAEEWRKNIDRQLRASWLSDEARAYALEIPIHDVEVKVFSSSDQVYGDIVVWKSLNPNRCVTKPSGQVQIYQEWPRSMSFYLSKALGDEAQAKLLWDIFTTLNLWYYYHVVIQGNCPNNVKNLIRIESAEVFKVGMSLFGQLMGGMLGLSGMGNVNSRADFKGIKGSPLDYSAGKAPDTVSAIKDFVDKWACIRSKYWSKPQRDYYCE